MEGSNPSKRNKPGREIVEMNFRETANVASDAKRSEKTDRVIDFLNTRLAAKLPVAQYEDETVLVADLKAAGIEVTPWIAAEAVEEFLQSKTAAGNKTVVIDNNKSKTKATEGPANAKVLKDQSAPVLSSDDSLDKEADRKIIKRVEEDGSGVKRTEEIVEESGPIGFSEEPQEETEEDDPNVPQGAEPKEDEGQPAGSNPYGGGSTPDSNEDDEKKKTTSSEDKLMAALRLAKLAASLGLIDTDEDLNWAARFESETMEQIEARHSTLEMVKSAGLTKTVPPKRLVSKAPSFLGIAPTPTADTGDDMPIESIFI